MGVRLTSQEGKTALFDSVTDTAFGPVFNSKAEAEGFLGWLSESWGTDPRDYAPNDLQGMVDAYRLIEVAKGRWP